MPISMLKPTSLKIPTSEPLPLSNSSFSPPLCLHYSPLSTLTSPNPDSVSTIAASVLNHHRSKSRWSHLRTLFPSGFTPSQVSQTTLLLRHNPHLALHFFLWTQSNSLCSHTISSYSTIVHVLARARLKAQAQSLIQSALRVTEPGIPDRSGESSTEPEPPKIFKTLVRSYRACDSAPFVFDLLIKACLQCNRIDQAIAVARVLRSRMIYPNVRTCNSLIRSVLRCQGPEYGYGIYREVFGLDDGSESKLGKVKVYPNAQTFNELMLGFYQDGAIEKVDELWAEMMKLNCLPNAYSYSILMASYCDERKMTEAERLWGEMQGKGMKHDVVAYNTIIGGFCKIGEVERAEEYFREMILCGVEGTCVTYENLVDGHCKIGDVDSAILLYKDMLRKGLKPGSLTTDVVIGGLCDKGRTCEALDIFRVALGDGDYLPGRKSFESLIKSFTKEGKMGEALKLQEKMVGKGFEPNSEIYCAFIDGYSKEGNEEVAERLRKELLETQRSKNKIR